MLNRDNALSLFSSLIDCSREAGIQDAFFPGFGTLLGIIREGNIKSHDHDLDMCILRDKITKEQEEKYYNACEKRKLFRYRKRIEKRTNGRYEWISLCPVPREKEGVKSCNWFFFEHKGYMWHTKGKGWVRKFDKQRYEFDDSYHSVGKGIDAGLFDTLIDCPVDFFGLSFKIPLKYGTILDEWYPNWAFPKRGGASSRQRVLVIKDWGDKNTWKIKK